MRVDNYVDKKYFVRARFHWPCCWPPSHAPALRPVSTKMRPWRAHDIVQKPCYVQFTCKSPRSVRALNRALRTHSVMTMCTRRASCVHSAMHASRAPRVYAYA